MLFELLLNYVETFTFLNVFKYITFRTGLAFFTSLLIALLIGGPFIRFFSNKKIFDPIREDGPSDHIVKKIGTPTMGGVIILLGLFLSVLFWGDLSNKNILFCLYIAISFGLLGALDDYKKIKYNNSSGISSKFKIFAQILLAIIGVSVFVYFSDYQNLTNLYFPFFKNLIINLGWFFIPFSVFVIIGSSNAVNLTDGLDGLAAGSSTLSFSAFTVISFWAFRHPEIYDLDHALDLAVVAVSMLGACVGFLWWNSAPAKIFMGDTGSLAIGTALACLALATNTQLLLPIIGGIFVLETISVVVQIIGYRWMNKRRIFRMAPFHHHFELLLH